MSESAKATLRRRALRLQEDRTLKPATLPEAGSRRPLLVILPSPVHPLGSVLALAEGDLVSRHFVVAERNGDAVVAQYVEEGQEEAFVVAARARLESALRPATVPDEDGAGEYVRTLPVRYDRTGERFRTFQESVGVMYEEPFKEEDWPLEGPRSAMWWLRATRRQGLTAHHEAPASLIPFEFLVRRLQLIEEAHSYEGSEHWMGSGRRKGGVLVSPAFAKHVATRVREDTEVAKERRKAKEERRMAPGKKGGGKGGDDAAAKDGK